MDLKPFLKIITDENDPLFEYNKIPLNHNRTNGAFTPKPTSRLRSNKLISAL